MSDQRIYSICVITSKDDQDTILSICDSRKDADEYIEKNGNPDDYVTHVIPLEDALWCEELKEHAQRIVDVQGPITGMDRYKGNMEVEAQKRLNIKNGACPDCGGTGWIYAYDFTIQFCPTCRKKNKQQEATTNENGRD